MTVSRSAHEGDEVNAVEPYLMNVAEAAESLRMSPRWLKAVIADGQIPTVMLGRRRLIRPKDLDAFIEARVEKAA